MSASLACCVLGGGLATGEVNASTNAHVGVSVATATPPSWAQFHDTARRLGYNADETVLNPGNASSLHVK